MIASEEIEKIEAALLSKAFVVPRKRRKLLIFGLNVDYRHEGGQGHLCIQTANQAFTMMGSKTGAFETEISLDAGVFAPERLKQFDAVFLNNSVGNLFEDPVLRQSLVEFIYAGGGMMGVHGASIAFQKWPIFEWGNGIVETWPEFAIMLGARGATHKMRKEHVFIKLEDPAHPINQAIGGKDFDYYEQFFRLSDPYSRDRVRVLWSIDTDKTDMTQSPSYGNTVRDDNDYALAYVRQYGLGRIFYTCLGDAESTFWDEKMLQFFLAGTQFVLGDLAASTIPSARINPPLIAQEKLNWRLSLVPDKSTDMTLFETIDKASQLGISYIGSREDQRIVRHTPHVFNGHLSSEEMSQIRLRLDRSGIRLLTYHTESKASDRAVEFARRMGAEITSDIENLTVGAATEIVKLDGSARAKGIGTILDRIHRHPNLPIIFNLNYGGDWDEESCVSAIELFNKKTVELAGHSLGT